MECLSLKIAFILSIWLYSTTFYVALQDGFEKYEQLKDITKNVLKFYPFVFSYPEDMGTRCPHTRLRLMDKSCPLSGIYPCVKRVDRFGRVPQRGEQVRADVADLCFCLAQAFAYVFDVGVVERQEALRDGFPRDGGAADDLSGRGGTGRVGHQVQQVVEVAGDVRVARVPAVLVVQDVGADRL